MSLLSARKKMGMSQAEVAREIGVTDAAVCQWEKGLSGPKRTLLPKLAALYGCTVDELLKPDKEDE